MTNYSIESFIEETNRANSAQEVSGIFGNALKQFGYDRFCYSLITPHPSLGLDAGHGIARNYPEDWMAHYEANGYVKKDPVPAYGFTTSEPFAWDDVVQNRKLKPEQLKVMNEAKEAKLLDGLAYPIYGRSGELAGVGMASSVGGTRPDKILLRKIHALVQQFHVVYTDFVGQRRPASAGTDETIHLTGREQEILLWASEGKSDFAIADILKVSRSTVRFHMNNIFKKLDANERTLATVKAIRLGLIVPRFVK
jgi:DNA-binding CsgD family transcriptional regulator